MQVGLLGKGCQGGKVVQGVKRLLPSLTPCLIPEAQKVEEENEFRKLSSDPTCVPTNK